MTLLEQIQIQLRKLPPDQQNEVLDFVSYLQYRLSRRKSAASARQRKAIEHALQRLSASASFANIDDPVAWQKQVRRDRPIPGRAE